MDAREARQYTTNNPPTDTVLAERRPSLLGRLFRQRTSSTSEAEPTLSSSPPAGGGGMNMAASGFRRGSISEAVQAQQVSANAVPPPKQPILDPHVGLFT